MNNDKKAETSHAPEMEQEIKTGWSNAPSLIDLKQDLTDAKPAKDAHVADVNKWLDVLHVEGTSKPPKNDRRSSIQPKVVKKNNEWRYPSLTEPFLNTSNVFNVSPYTFEDKEAARQNELVLNYQFNNKINKVSFIDDYVRTAVNEGTVFVRVGWKEIEEEVETIEAQYEIVVIDSEEDLIELKEEMEKGENASPEWIEAFMESQATGVPHKPSQIEDLITVETKLTANHPTVEVVDYNNIIVDPTCNGVLSEAKFVIYSFETSKADLEATGLYSNLDAIVMQGNSILSASDDSYDNNDNSYFNFKDEPRKKFVAYEYWGWWDVEGNGVLKAIVATWVGDTLIRMSENPYPDNSVPFVSAQYSPVTKSLYGEPDSEFLEDNQKVIGATMRGMIDIMARSANGQTGMRKDMLDVVNRRRFENGQDYEFSPTVDPRNGIHMHKFAEIPNSAHSMLSLQMQEVETMTGVRAFGPTSSDTSAATATHARGTLDAASKRETAILRRMSNGIKEIGQKIISMNQEFLEDEEIIRITNEDFVAIKREDLAGRFDLVLDISTAEEDNSKADQLAFMIQTVGPNADPKLVNDIMADIADLRRMPETAHRLRAFEPKPDPMAQAMAEIELEKLKLENAKLQLEMKKLDSEVLLNNQKAGVENAKQSNISADTDLKNLEYVEEEQGVKHERSMEHSGAQAKANMERDFLNHQMRAKEKAETDKEKANPFRDAINQMSLNSIKDTEQPQPTEVDAGNEPQAPLSAPSTEEEVVQDTPNEPSEPLV